MLHKILSLPKKVAGTFHVNPLNRKYLLSENVEWNSYIVVVVFSAALSGNSGREVGKT